MPDIAGRVDDIVRGADAELQCRHRDAEPERHLGRSPCEEGDGTRDDSIEDRWKRVDESDEAGQEGDGRRERRAATGRT